MAVEQALVMGIAIAFLFVRMLSEADKADERAERLADREAEKAAQRGPLDAGEQPATSTSAAAEPPRQ